MDRNDEVVVVRLIVLFFSFLSCIFFYQKKNTTICVITTVPILSILEDKDLPRPLSSMSSRYLRMTMLVVVYIVRKKEKTVQVYYT